MRTIEKADIASLKPLLCSVKAGCAMLGISDRLILHLIAKGDIQAVKGERRTLLVVESVEDYVAKLKAKCPAKGTLMARPRHRADVEIADPAGYP
jgi:hypothetical protein